MNGLIVELGADTINSIVESVTTRLLMEQALFGKAGNTLLPDYVHDAGLVGVSWVMGRCGVSDKTVYEWVRREEIPHLKFNSALRFDRKEVEAWIDKNRHTPTGALKRKIKAVKERVAA